MNWLTAKELAEKLGVSESTAMRAVRNGAFRGAPLQVKVEPNPRGGKPIYYASFDGEVGESAVKELPATTLVPAVEEVKVAEVQTQVEEVAEVQTEVTDLKAEFEELLRRKLLGKTDKQRASLRCIYKKQYCKTGEIPPALWLENGRKLSGRKRVIASGIEERFVSLVRASTDLNSPEFITQPLRKVVSFQRILEEEFQCEVDINALYRLVKAHKLKEFLLQEDYEEEEKEKEGGYFFKHVQPFDIIQMDGVSMDYIEIKDEKNNWKKPVAIEFMDTGTRYMFAIDVYFSESNENSTDIFCKFLRETAFPVKQITLRPDNAKGFHSLSRPIHELNVKHGRSGFELLDVFARPLSPRQKAHLESSHRVIHGFEVFIIRKFAEKMHSRYDYYEERARSRRLLRRVDTVEYEYEFYPDSESGYSYGDCRRHTATCEHKSGGCCVGILKIGGLIGLLTILALPLGVVTDLVQLGVISSSFFTTSQNQAETKPKTSKAEPKKQAPKAETMPSFSEFLMSVCMVMVCLFALWHLFTMLAAGLTRNFSNIIGSLIIMALFSIAIVSLAVVVMS